MGLVFYILNHYLFSDTSLKLKKGKMDSNRREILMLRAIAHNVRILQIDRRRYVRTLSTLRMPGRYSEVGDYGLVRHHCQHRQALMERGLVYLLLPHLKVVGILGHLYESPIQTHCHSTRGVSILS
jgi:hypothetical protein